MRGISNSPLRELNNKSFVTSQIDNCTDDLQLCATKGTRIPTEDREEGRIFHWLSTASLEAILTRIHPACRCFEPQEADVLRLAESLELTGPRQPIELLDDKLLDGHSRVQAALRIGISLPAVVITEEDLHGLSPFQYALRNNRAAACGRALNDLQIALVATKCDNAWFSAAKAAAQQRQANGGKAKDDDRGSVYELAAKKYQVSAHCLKIANAVIACGNETIYEHAYAGRFSLAAIRRIVKRPESEWAQALEGEMVAASQPKKRRRGATNQTTVEDSHTPEAEQPMSQLKDIEVLLHQTQIVHDAIGLIERLLLAQETFSPTLPMLTLAVQHFERLSAAIQTLIPDNHHKLGDVE